MKRKIEIITNTIRAILSRIAYTKDSTIDINKGANLIASYRKFNLAIILNLETIFNTRIKIFTKIFAKIFNLKIRVLAIIIGISSSIDILFFITSSKTLIIRYLFSTFSIANTNTIERRYRLLGCL